MNKKALYKITYGLYIVCSSSKERFNGQVANTLIQVCSEPVILSVAINKNNYTHELIKESGYFTATVLQKDTSLSFIGNFGFKSGRLVNKFDGVKYQISDNGLPIVIDNGVAFFEAKVIDSLAVHTHTIFLGEVINADLIEELDVMTYAYYQEVKRGTTPRSAPSYIEKGVDTPMIKKYKCSICGYIYDPQLGDPDGGIKPGIPFEELPDGWVCPICGAGKDQFELIN